MYCIYVEWDVKLIIIVVVVVVFIKSCQNATYTEIDNSNNNQ